MRKSWTKEEDALLTRLIKEKTPPSVINKELGRAGSSVRLRAGRLGFSDLKYGEANRIYKNGLIEEFKICKSGGMPNKEICKKLNLSESQVHYLIGRTATPGTRRRRWDESNLSKLIESIKRGDALGYISRAFMVSAKELALILKNIPEDRMNEDINRFLSKITDKRLPLIKQKLGTSEARAIGQGWAFELSLDIILKKLDKQNYKCYYTGLPLTFDVKMPNTISIDRIDSQIGYTIENSVICCWDINRMKQDIELDHFIKLCGLVYSHMNDLDKSSGIL